MEARRAISLGSSAANRRQARAGRVFRTLITIAYQPYHSREREPREMRSASYPALYRVVLSASAEESNTVSSYGMDITDRTAFILIVVFRFSINFLFPLSYNLFFSSGTHR